MNGTLLDIEGLRPGVISATGGDFLALWFATTLRSSMVASITGQYSPFDELAVEAMCVIAGDNGVALDRESAEQVVAGFERLRPHGDVVPALDSLLEAGVRIAALSNSSQRVLDAQITNAGLNKYFELLISVEAVEAFKPDPRVYRHAAFALRVPIESLWLVAAHDWDVTGAKRAGAHGALVNRSAAASSRVDEKPDIIGTDLEDVVDQLIAWR